MDMRVSLANLGDGARVFYNRLGRPVTIPVGKIVTIDLSEKDVEGLRNPARVDTVYVGEPDEVKLPDGIREVVDLLAIIDSESHEELLRRFHAIAPPNNVGAISKMQMRVVLRHMTEDWITAQKGGTRRRVKDDVDPRQLERERELEQREIERTNYQEPVHPLKQASDDARESAAVAAPAASPAPRRKKVMKGKKRTK